MAAREGIRIGVASEVITPPLPVSLSGYGDRAGEATEVHDDLDRKSVV